MIRLADRIDDAQPFVPGAPDGGIYPSCGRCFAYPTGAACTVRYGWEGGAAS
ncbi:MAG: hypothetical protein ACAI43_05700 [Phycisphaerae bacterium]